ncbi:MAG: hypothetical protein K8U57_35385 [Planctomycetes bacterium]|nr:hypothetical protein [Planctomycetota bacterium]
MDPDELLKMLDLSAAPARPPDDPIPTTPPAPPAQDEEASSTALHLDEWGLRRGRDLIVENERLKKINTDEFAAADFFGVAFEPDPQLEPRCREVRRHAFLTQMLETPDYHSLHAATQLDDTAAAIAAIHFAEQFAQLKKDDPKEKDDPKDKPEKGVNTATAAANELAREMATLRAVGRAVAEAGKEVSELHEATTALGMGPGNPGSNDPRAIAALYKRVRGDSALRKICDLAGRFRRVAQSKQRMKSTHGLDDVVGVEPGGDIGRLLPIELAKLVVPELELDTLRRIAERQALCREHHSTEPVGKGPIIVSVDESGSMQGQKAHTAKGLALALAWIARSQKRWCGLLAYSGDSGERLLALPPGRWDEAALCNWLTQFIGHGSELDIPVREMPDYYRRLGAPHGITDLVFITDAKCKLDSATQTRFLTWKQSAQARLISLVIDNSPGDLAAISDEVHSVRSLDPTDDAVGKVLSL